MKLFSEMVVGLAAVLGLILCYAPAPTPPAPPSKSSVAHAGGAAHGASRAS